MYGPEIARSCEHDARGLGCGPAVVAVHRLKPRVPQRDLCEVDRIGFVDGLAIVEHIVTHSGPLASGTNMVHTN